MIPRPVFPVHSARHVCCVVRVFCVILAPVTDRPTDRPTNRPTGTDHPTPGHGHRHSRPAPTGHRPATDQSGGRSGDHHEPRWLTVALPVAIWTLTVVVTFLALSGQVEFAQSVGITDWRRYLVPAGLELAAVGFLLVGYRRARHGYSPASAWSAAALIGAFAVWTNLNHAGLAGPVFGAFTVVALLLWFVKFRDDYMRHQQGTGQATGRRPRFGWRMWVTAPRLTCRAWLIAIRLQVGEVATAVMYAELWRAVHRGRATGRSGRERRAAAWRQVMVAAGHPVADIPTVAELATVHLVDRPAPALADQQPTGDADQPAGRPTGQNRPRRQPKPTGRRTDRPLRVVWSPTVVANAAMLRARYGDQLPTDRRVRDEMGWSYDRAKSAIAAYRAGADRSGDRPADQDDDKEDAA